MLDAAKQTFRIHERGHGLNQAGGRMRLHQFHQVHEGFAAHHAVGVAANKIAVAHSPGVEKVADVAALARFVKQTAAIINFSERGEVTHKLGPARLLLDPAVGIGRVAQDEKVEAIKLAGAFERFVSGAQTFEDADGIFVVNREDDSRACAVDAFFLVRF